MNYSFERPEELLIVMFFLGSSFENQICYNEEEHPEWQSVLLEKHHAHIVLWHVAKSMLFAN